MKIDIYPNSKSFIVLFDFICYCNANPELRFWQALLNWSGQKFILFSSRCPLEIANGEKSFFIDPYNFKGKDA